ncbi:hypothetical protein BJ742DRAFT_287076 [Cladochytrium replicatum]|nr:hypothetical protein BJ742DRAFT_287076 [Cladochytrium replicatum]
MNAGGFIASTCEAPGVATGGEKSDVGNPNDADWIEDRSMVIVMAQLMERRRTRMGRTMTSRRRRWGICKAGRAAVGGRGSFVAGGWCGARRRLMSIAAWCRESGKSTVKRSPKKSECRQAIASHTKEKRVYLNVSTVRWGPWKRLELFVQYAYTYPQARCCLSVHSKPAGGRKPSPRSFLDSRSTTGQKDLELASEVGARRQARSRRQYSCKLLQQNHVRIV